MNRTVATLTVFFTLLLTPGLALERQVAVEKQPAERAILAGGCFWCMEHPFENLPG